MIYKHSTEAGRGERRSRKRLGENQYRGGGPGRGGVGQTEERGREQEVEDGRGNELRDREEDCMDGGINNSQH